MRVDERRIAAGRGYAPRILLVRNIPIDNDAHDIRHAREGIKCKSCLSVEVPSASSPFLSDKPGQLGSNDSPQCVVLGYESTSTNDAVMSNENDNEAICVCVCVRLLLYSLFERTKNI